MNTHIDPLLTAAIRAENVHVYLVSSPLRLHPDSTWSQRDTVVKSPVRDAQTRRSVQNMCGAALDPTAHGLLRVGI